MRQEDADGRPVRDYSRGITARVHDSAWEEVAKHSKDMAEDAEFMYPSGDHRRGSKQ